MFDQTWNWAGEYRCTEKNIGVAVHEVRERLVAFDVRYWIENHTYSPDEIPFAFTIDSHLFIPFQTATADMHA